MIKRTYFIDGEKVKRFGDVIKKAQKYGYHEPSGLYTTSRACGILEENGHKVKCVEKQIDD